MLPASRMWFKTSFSSASIELILRGRRAIRLRALSLDRHVGNAVDVRLGFFFAEETEHGLATGRAEHLREALRVALFGSASRSIRTARRSAPFATSR
jgi:hypothetical protein